MAIKPEGFGWDLRQRQNNEYPWASGPSYERGQSHYIVGWNSYMPSTVCYSRWETLQKVNPSRQAKQKNCVWGLEQLCITYGTPMDIDSDQGTHVTDQEVQEWADEK